MVISNMPVEYCPRCNNVLDYFSAFMAHGKRCRNCGWVFEKNEITGEETESNYFVKEQMLPLNEYYIIDWRNYEE